MLCVGSQAPMQRETQHGFVPSGHAFFSPMIETRGVGICNNSANKDHDRSNTHGSQIGRYLMIIFKGV